MLLRYAGRFLVLAGRMLAYYNYPPFFAELTKEKIVKPLSSLLVSIALVHLFTTESIAYAANGMNVGRYMLGMTNSEAAKIGLDKCAATLRGRIECEPKFSDVSDLRRATLEFDPKSKRLIAITVKRTIFPKTSQSSLITSKSPMENWQDSDWVALTDALLAQTIRELHLPDCKSKLQERKNRIALREEYCHILPDQTREIISGFNDEYVGGRNGRNDPHVFTKVSASVSGEAKAFIRTQKLKQDERKKADRLKQFQNGL